MLKGTASRVLFGDPSLIVADAFTGPPFRVTMVERGRDALGVTATLANPALKSTFTARTARTCRGTRTCSTTGPC